jgi:uncharacterized 2Fe-2S/4Fe-4S cluster protein (DUF4445 family)
MPDEQVRVTFQPNGRSVYVLPGTSVLEASSRAGLTIDTPCGGRGTCGKCRVQFQSGACEPTAQDRAIFEAGELAEGWRLACQTRICRECRIYVPDSSLFASQHQIFAEAAEGAQQEVQPAVRKCYVQLSEPSLADHAADLARLEQAVGPFRVELAMLRRLPRLLRENDFAGTAVLADHRLVDFEPGDTSGQCYGVAFDIGTTTVVGSLLELCGGTELQLTSRMNPQVSFGDDVVSRIEHATASTENLAQLRDSITRTLQEMIDELCRAASVKRSQVYEVVIAGNTTMEHLLCGMDVAQLGHVPFVPVFSRGLMLRAADMGLSIADRGGAYVFPVIGGFVGGDTVAGVLATRLDREQGAALMIDIGTNGEIVLSAGGKLWAASTAAGPAFEGARISCGMRATRGAIEKVVLADGEVHVSVIGGARPAGICGSGLIDAAAELLRAGLITPEGRLLPREDLPEAVPASLAARIVRDGEDVAFLLAGGADAGAESRVLLTQRDIREMQLATGALRAGVKILCKQAGIEPAELGRVLIAGGFGSFIRRSNAQRIGLLPAGVDREKIHYVGNASLNGARWALVSEPARKAGEQLGRGTEHVELSMDMQFQMEFAEAMIFPDS